MQRRNFLFSTALAGFGAAGASSRLESFSKVIKHVPALKEYQPVKPEIVTPNGAVYIPAKAFNTWQQWKDYNENETERDFGYATSIGLNSLRIWLSYEYWLEDPKRHEESLEHMLMTAENKGLKLLMALFDSKGIENTYGSRENRNPKTALAIISPSNEISSDLKRWHEPAMFVNRIMEQFANDKRLLAIEIMNEPIYLNNRMAMSRFLFKVAQEKKGFIPLTIGSFHGMQNWGNFMDLGIDILQFHNNFPSNLTEFNNELEMAKQVAEVLGRPMWITEWQRLRVSNFEGNKENISPDELFPNLVSLAGTVRDAEIGNYFWSLMLKPAYL
ncbi:MAG: hypothetical protein EP310_00765, partial [Bacteroidetes bacterium]